MKLPEPFPLSWPGAWPRSKTRKSSRYRVSMSRAREDIAESLKELAGGNFVVSSNVKTRYDGLPLLNQPEPEDTAVAVWWEQNSQVRVLACDYWNTVRENLRAVGTALNALQTLQRSGATQILDKAMEAFDTPLRTAPSAYPWWFSYLELSAWPPDESDVKRKVNLLSLRYHPDHDTGSHEAFVKLMQAKYDAERFLGAP